MQHRPWKKSKFQSTTLIAVVVLLLILLSLVGYFFTLPDIERARQAEQLQADLAQQLERWHAGKPLAYRYVVERECYCPGEDLSPYTVTVMADGPTEVSAPGASRIDDLFRIASDAATGKNKVEVVFDSRFGYPSRIRIDDLEGGRASIETYRIRDFEVIDYGRPGDTG